MPIVKVPMLANWKVDVAGLKKAVDDFDGFSIVYFVNPNNPTSTVTPASEIDPWVRSKPDNTLFIADEAYAEYVSDPNFKSMANLIQDGLDNVVLLKTFSKLYAMAGMRVGFAVGAPAIIKMMKDQVSPRLWFHWMMSRFRNIPELQTWKAARFWLLVLTSSVLNIFPRVRTSCSLS